MEYYYVGCDNNPYRINLYNKKDKVEFQQAYIIFNGERIDMTSCIQQHDDEIYIDPTSMAYKLQEIGKINNIYDIDGTIQKIELIKDGKSYFGDVEISWIN